MHTDDDWEKFSVIVLEALFHIIQTSFLKF
jgi:hypothetical protein